MENIVIFEYIYIYTIYKYEIDTKQQLYIILAPNLTINCNIREDAE